MVASLERRHFDALYEAQSKYEPGKLGERATKDFILRHVFGIAPELIKQPSDLLRMLLRRHYRRQTLPRTLDERLIQVLRQSGQFDQWPLEEIVPDREAFFSFLQDRWPTFLEHMIDRIKSGKWEVREEQESKRYASYTTHVLPFDHDDVRVYIDNLFIEGLLKPVSHPQGEILADTWAAVGVLISSDEYQQKRIERLLDQVEDRIPNLSSSHRDWLDFAPLWAELLASIYGSEEIQGKSAFSDPLEELITRVDSAFVEWVMKRFNSLMNLPPAPPVMLHHIPRYLARHVQEWPIAFLLIDGLSLDQWVSVKGELQKLSPDLTFHQDQVFAWIPTITSVSRQAVFSGSEPFYFPASINTTAKEESLWMRFWTDQNQGLSPRNVAYLKGVDEEGMNRIAELLDNPGLRVVGLVIDKVDKIMHGMELGAAGMHNQVKQWVKGGFLANLVSLLLEKGFRVFISSDHGNIEAVGMGGPKEGSIADIKGERVRVYPDPALRAQVKKKFPNSLEWPPVGLPEGFYPLIAKSRNAFISKGRRTVAHGGITVEEVIVPFVEVKRKPNEFS